MARPVRPARKQPAGGKRGRGSLRAGLTARVAMVERRLRIGFLVIAMIVSVFAVRLVQLQGIDPRQYAAMAAAEGTVDVVLPAERGRILDRNGVPFADSVAGLMIVADPSLTAAKAPQMAKVLAKRLGVDYFATLERLRARKTRFQYIARQVPASLARTTVESLTKHGFKGLDTREDPLREYPRRQVAANLVGFLGTPKRNGAARPSAGLEAAFNRYLSGRDGTARYEVGAGNLIPLGDNTVAEPRNGQDLSTTIDSDLQWYAQQVLRQTVRGARADSGYAVIMDSRSGELLTVADYPTYDASDPAEYEPSLYNSRALTDVYEPGSVEKVLTVSGLIDAGKVTARTRFKVPGVLEKPGNQPIHDFFVHDVLHLTMAGIIAKSSNIGTTLAADNYRPGQLRRYLSAFGLGQRTNIGVPGETRGILPPDADWTSQTADRIAFGQSLSVNAVQMAAAVNTIANGGVRISPSLIKGVATLDSGERIGTDVATRRRVVSQDAAHQTTLMMERVVDPTAGVAPAAQVPGYVVAGKTGTAQRVGENCRCYDGTFTVSFAGFAPADDPRFTIYVVVQNPRNGGGGGSVAGPAFAKMMGYTLRRYGVPPTGGKPSQIPVEW